MWAPRWLVCALLLAAATRVMGATSGMADDSHGGGAHGGSAPNACLVEDVGADCVETIKTQFHRSKAQICRELPRSEIEAAIRAGCGGATLVNDLIMDLCRESCPDPDAADLSGRCSTHPYHTSFVEWRDEGLEAWGELQWNVLFVLISLIVGSIMQRALGSQVPYTVGVLVVFLVVGLVAEALLQGRDCPWHAWALRPAGANYVDRSTWDRFVGKGIHPASYCAENTCGCADGACGNGTTPGSCSYAFDELNRPFKLSHMLPTSIANVEPDVLSADQLWTARCNLLRDVLRLSDIDPHAILVIFLPALLFESACFGVDIGIFRKQIAQALARASRCTREGARLRRVPPSPAVCPP